MNSDPAQAMPGPVNRRKEALNLVGSLTLAGVLLFGIRAFWNDDFEPPMTRDGVVEANVVQVRPQVNGRIVSLSVRPNQFVKAGQELFRIDPRQYQEALLAAEQALMLVRRKNLTNPASVDTLPTQSDVQQSRGDGAEATVRLARLKLGWTRVVAPADGTVTGMSLRVGDVVEAYDELFAFVESGQWWVQANFKETDIEAIEPGMQARVTIDIYGEHHFSGVVDSVSRSSAASLSLFPTQNTTGNWVKVTQRFPVRILLLDADAERPYRYGASATVAIDLEGPRLGAGAALAR